MQTDETGFGRLLKPKEVARLLALSESEVYALLRRREMPGVRMGRAVRVPAALLEKWVAERMEGGR